MIMALQYLFSTGLGASQYYLQQIHAGHARQHSATLVWVVATKSPRPAFGRVVFIVQQFDTK
jgi:hypothetical protein